MPLSRPLAIRQAQASDAELLICFIRELALAEDLPYPVTVTEDDLLENLFGSRPVAEALIGFSSESPACFAVFYETFSTTTGRRGLHLDDLFVRPQYQGSGYGKAMLQYVAAIAESRKCARLEWWTLRTNERALGFFQSVGARRLNELVIHRAENVEIQRLTRNEP